MTPREFVEERRGVILELLRRLVGIDSRTGREGPIAQYLEGWLKVAGLEARLEPYKDRWNVVAWSGKGDPTLVFSGHLDTVHPLEGAWTSDPWTPVEAQGRLVGLGSSDMKASLASAAFAALYHKERGLPGRVVLAFTVEEETTGDGTSAFVLGAVTSGFLPPSSSAVVVMEPTGLDHVSLGNRGSTFVTVTVRGEGGHGARPHLAKNPIPKLCGILAAVSALEERWAARYPDPELGGVSLTPTCVRAGDPAQTNSIPEVGSLVLDCRVTRPLEDADFTIFRSELSAFLRRFEEPGYAIEVREEFARVGHKLPAEHPLAQTALAVLRDDLGIPDARFVHTPAANDSVYFARAGLPTINKLGPGDPAQAHKGNESVDLEKVVLGAVAYARLAERWLAGSGEAAAPPTAR
ncbi:MAG: M20/M25/M40 family metallo-hydrolase [Planctomycetes bacterium]|nr:M20/M25/M40 family metallo-hydrolase [Planctomycetota bacterium]